MKRVASAVGVHRKTLARWSQAGPVRAEARADAHPPPSADDPWGEALDAIALTALAQVDQICGPPRVAMHEADVLELLLEHGSVSDDALAALYEQKTGQEVSRLTVQRRRHYAARRLADMADDLRGRFGPAGAQAARRGVAVLRKVMTA